MEKQNTLQRMYLEKSKNEDIYIETVPLPSYEYEGIRFLYKQFKKGRPGVVLNDPSGYGKRVQTVLFINVIRKFLKQPILIICNDGKENMWLDLFYQWTNMGPQVSIQRYEVIVKPVCIIATMDHVRRMQRRDFSLLVVDDINIAKGVLYCGLEAKFKIWITSFDMKKNLLTFTYIQKWFYPMDTITIEEIELNTRTPRTLLKSSIKLDALLEDIVFRRRNTLAPLERNNDAAPFSMVTRKNKDATGKKIKRSKPTNVTESQPLDNTEPRHVSPARVPENGKIDSKNAKNIKLCNVALNEDKGRSHNGPKTRNINKDVGQGKSDTMEFNFITNDNAVVPQSNPFMECDTVNDTSILLNNESINSQNITIRYDSDTPNIDDNVANDNIPTETTKHKLSCSNQNVSEDLFSADTSDNKVNSNVDMEARDTNHKNNKASSEDLFSKDLPSSKENVLETDDINIKGNELPIKDKLVKTKTNVDNLNENEMPTNDVIETKTDDVNPNETDLVSKVNVSENIKTDPVLDGIELKMKQMEELALKKFKGSCLDKMF